jgi:hypothetical protein
VAQLPFSFLDADDHHHEALDALALTQRRPAPAA